MEKHIEERISISFVAFLLITVCIAKWGYAKSSYKTRITLKPKNKTRNIRKSDIRVSGRVTDASSGKTLPGVNVILKGTTTGTSTDKNGHYSLNVPSSQDTLIFSFVGYQTKNVPIRGRKNINVTLKKKTISGQQLVVVGYGTEKKSNLAGAQTTISSTDLQDANITSPDQALQGRVAGVNVHTNSHAPGGSISVTVRGTSSLTAGGSPLYVVDGVPISTDYQTGQGSGGVGNGSRPNPLNSIDLSNVANIEVLKGASAAAIYGSRAANGVVLITTKQGKKNSQNVDFQSSVGISTISHKLNFMNATQYARQINEGQKELGNPPTYSQQQIAGFGKGTDWQNRVFRQAVSENYNLTFSGGTNNLTYMLSGNTKMQNGIIRNSGFNRYGVKANIQSDISKKLTVGANLSYNDAIDNRVRTSAKGYGSQPGLISSVISAPPTIPARDSLGNLSNFSSYTGGGGNENPLILTNKYKEQSNTNRFVGNFHFTYDILNDLELKSRFGADLRNWRYYQYFPIGSQASSGSNGKAHQSSELTTNIVSNTTLTWDKQLKNQEIKLLGGYSYQQQKDNNLGASAYGFPSDYYKYNNLGLGTSPQAPSSSASKWTLVSYFGRVHYTLLNKYILTGSFRVDGDSKFGANNKYGTFPAVSAAWKLGNEKFVKNLNLFSHLKLRFGYGQTGDASIGTYQSLSTISTSNGQFGAYAYNGTQVPIAYPSGIANPDLSWEKTAEFNYGLDMGFFNDRLTISANYYDKKTTAMLLNQPIPRQSGFASVLTNIGKMQNKGVEVDINSENVVSPSFHWSTSFNISGNRNKVLSLGGTPYIYTGWGIYAGNYLHSAHTTRVEPGHSVNNFYGAVYDGLWKSQKQINQVGTMPSATPGSIRYKDLNGDGQWNQDDSKFLGTATPKFQFGLTNNLSYKQFDLHVFVYGEYGNKVYDIPLEKTLYNGSGLSAKRVKGRWTSQNPNNPYPAASAGSMFTINSADVVDGSFLRFKNVTLTYHIPISKGGLGGLRKASVGVAVDNLAIITSYPGYDPEVNSFGSGHSTNTTQGVDRYAYPASRTIRFNIKLGF